MKGEVQYLIFNHMHILCTVCIFYELTLIVRFLAWCIRPFWLFYTFPSLVFIYRTYVE
jgi:hypothetical protein